MKKFARAALLASAAAAGLAFAPAGPATAASSAELTIAQLEAQGFDVEISRIGSAPLDACEVSSIGKAREQKQLRRFRDDFIEVVVRRAISVSLDCSR
jgi:muramoyltetrapeptide carboxypeptidase LdcA involved in peptidoglycan recycling